MYGTVGYTDGHSISQIGVGLMTKNGHVFHPADLQNLKFKLDFKGTTYGIGTTLVGGVGNWFTAVDANYTRHSSIFLMAASTPLPSHLALVTVLPPGYR